MRLLGVTCAVAFWVLVGTAERASSAPTWITPFTPPFSQQGQPTFAFANGGTQFTAYIEVVGGVVDPNNAATRLIVSRSLPGAASTNDLVTESTPAGVPLLASLAVAPGGAVLNGDPFLRDGDPSLFTAATFDGTSWSLRLPKLRAGRATITARVRDAAGNASETAVEVRLR